MYYALQPGQYGCNEMSVSQVSAFKMKRFSIFISICQCQASREKEINFFKRNYSFRSSFFFFLRKILISLIELDEKLLNKMKNVELNKKNFVAIVFKMNKIREAF